MGKPRRSAARASRSGNPCMIDVLRREIADSGQSIREISEGTGIARPVLDRVMRDERDNLTLATADRLCHHLGLTLCRK